MELAPADGIREKDERKWELSDKQNEWVFVLGGEEMVVLQWRASDGKKVQREARPALVNAVISAETPTDRNGETTGEVNRDGPSSGYSAAIPDIGNSKGRAEAGIQETNQHDDPPTARAKPESQVLLKSADAKIDFVHV